MRVKNEDTDTFLSSQLFLLTRKRWQKQSEQTRKQASKRLQVTERRRRRFNFGARRRRRRRRRSEHKARSPTAAAASGSSVRSQCCNIQHPTCDCHSHTHTMMTPPQALPSDWLFLIRLTRHSQVAAAAAAALEAPLLRSPAKLELDAFAKQASGNCLLCYTQTNS